MRLSLSGWKWKWISLLPWQGVLPVTSALAILLILVPALQLRHFPRSNAAGLERLLTASALIQSFAADPSRAAPPLWQQRLGPDLARQLWVRQRGYWWQFWGRNGDGVEAFLALPARAFGVGSSTPLPPNGLRFDDLVVIAPDPLSRQLLQDDLRRNLRGPQGLQQRCVDQLRRGQAVAWTKTALAQLAGPLAPLLQRFQEGCLELGSDGLGLLWQGESRASSDPVGLRLAPALTSAQAAATLPPVRGPRSPLPPTLLLEVQGDRLDLLFQALFTRQLIRQPLAERYGLTAVLADRLVTIPFRLRLRPLPTGPYQASLELQLVVGKERREWEAWLPSLQKALEAQGLTQQSAVPPVPSIRSPLPPPSIWQRDDDTVVGGWRWVQPMAPLPAELVFFLGPVPPQAAGAPTTAGPTAGVSLRLRARPSALAAASLLPPGLPAVVRRAEQLEMVSISAATNGLEPAPLSWLWGSLQLGAPSAAGVGRR
jgi:hypothetical protein